MKSHVSRLEGCSFGVLLQIRSISRSSLTTLDYCSVARWHSQAWGLPSCDLDWLQSVNDATCSWCTTVWLSRHTFELWSAVAVNRPENPVEVTCPGLQLSAWLRSDLPAAVHLSCRERRNEQLALKSLLSWSFQGRAARAPSVNISMPSPNISIPTDLQSSCPPLSRSLYFQFKRTL